MCQRRVERKLRASMTTRTPPRHLDDEIRCDGCDVQPKVPKMLTRMIATQKTVIHAAIGTAAALSQYCIVSASTRWQHAPAR